MSLFKHDKTYYAVNDIKEINIHYDYDITKGDILKLKPGWWIKNYPKKENDKNVEWLGIESSRDDGSLWINSSHYHPPKIIDVHTKILNIKNVDATIKMKDGNILDFDLLDRHSVLKTFKKHLKNNYHRGLKKPKEYENIINLSNNSIKMHDHIKGENQNTILGFNFEDMSKEKITYSASDNLLHINEINDFSYSRFYLLFDPLGEDSNCIENAYEVIENFVKDFAHHHFDRFASNIGG